MALPRVAIFANDNSGSTDGRYDYAINCKKHLNDFLKRTKEGNFDHVHYLNWSNSCEETTYDELTRIYNEIEGCGGTCPEFVSEWILDNYPKASIELWLTTDGEICHSNVQRCVSINEKIDFDTVNFLIESRSPNVDCSVGASFICNTKSKVFLNGNLKKTLNTKNPFNYDEINIDNFDVIFPELKDFIQAKFMATTNGALQEETLLSQLRSRLLQSVEKLIAPFGTAADFSAAKSKTEVLDQIKRTTFYKNYKDTRVKDLRQKIDASISTLINYIHKTHKLHDFVDMKIEYKQNQMGEVEEEIEPAHENLPLVRDINFNDVISLEDSTKPLITINITDLFHELWKDDGNDEKTRHKSAKLFHLVCACPLVLLNNKQFKGIIGHTYDVASFQQCLQNADCDGTVADPQTRSRVFGGIIPFRQADQWNDYILLKSLFSGKKVYKATGDTYETIGMWYYVLYRFALQCEWINPSVLESLRTYAFARMNEGICSLSFTNLPLDPKEKVPIGIACWYVAELSTILFAENENYKLEKLRAFFPVSKHLVQIVKGLGYEDIDEDAVKSRSNTLYFVKKLKQIPEHCKKVLFLLDGLLEQKGPFFVPKVKDISKLNNFNYLTVSHEQRIPLKFPELTLDEVTRQYLLLSYDYIHKSDFEVCLHTFRPYYFVDKEKKVDYWVPLTNSLREVTTEGNNFVLKPDKTITKESLEQHKLISLCKTYIRYVTKKKEFPTLSEFQDYVLQRYQFNKVGNDVRVRIFPSNVLDAVEQTCEKYDECLRHFIQVEKPDPSEVISIFKERARASVSINERIIMEITARFGVRKKTAKKVERENMESRLLDRIKALKTSQLRSR